jgi:hypothetical protein
MPAQGDRLPRRTRFRAKHRWHRGMFSTLQAVRQTIQRIVDARMLLADAPMLILDARMLSCRD